MSLLDHLQNRILSRLPEDEEIAIQPLLELVDLPRDYQVATCNQRIEHIYFLEAGIGSVLSVSPEGQVAEAGMFGYEGFASTPPAAGSDLSLHDVVMQTPGFGHRIEVGALWSLLPQCPVLKDLLIKSLHNLATQVSYTALSNAVHPVDERLARWLLMCHDRVPGNELEITHEYISLMLSVRRPSVTTALHVLEGNGYIRSERKLITIRNRQAMEQFASDAYGKPEQEYLRLFRLP